MSPGSIMPPFPWLSENVLDISSTEKKISVMRKLGVPYPDGFETVANEELKKQADTIALDLTNAGIVVDPDKEIIAMIAYLQRLGTDIKAKKQ